jgi:hypothetical protein
VVVVVVVNVVVLAPLVVVVPPHSRAAHASQQLVALPTHALPPFGGLQDEPRCAKAGRRGSMRHVVAPAAVTRQQVTNSRLPHVERAAHRMTCPLQLAGSSPLRTRCLATTVAQCTYPP